MEGVSWSRWRHSPECCPDKSLPVFLVAWKQGEVRCVTCICTCMQPPQLLLLLLSAWEPQCPAIHSPLPLSLPKGSVPVAVWAKCEHRAEGSRAGAEVTLAAAARDWSCCRTQPVLNAQQECAPMFFAVCTLSQIICDGKWFLDTIKSFIYSSAT